MPVKRISLQLRSKTAEAQPAVSDPPPTPPSSLQENTQSTKAEPVTKGRPSRLKPTVPLHMTTRRHKSELESTVYTTQQDNQATKFESPFREIQRSTTSTTTSTTTATTTTTTTTTTSTAAAAAITTSTFQKMPPKRNNSGISEAHGSDEHMKKRLRGPPAPKANGVSNPVPPSAPKETSDTLRADAVKSAPAVIKRPRGRPPLKPKPSLPTIEKVDIATITATEPRKESSLVPVQNSTEPKSSTTSRAPSDIVRPKVPRQTLLDQYHRKQQLAVNHATTEQLRRRQVRIQQQYNLLAQLAKRNNTLLIDKSIEILSHVSDVDLARTEWTASILAGLEKAEEKRVEQIHFEKKIGLINALHVYDAERQRIEEEYKMRCSEIKQMYMQKSRDEIERLRREHDPLIASPQTAEGPTSEKISTCLSPGTEKLDALAVLAQKCEQHHRVQHEKTGVFHQASSPPLLQSGLV